MWRRTRLSWSADSAPALIPCTEKAFQSASERTIVSRRLLDAADGLGLGLRFFRLRRCQRFMQAIGEGRVLAFGKQGRIVGDRVEKWVEPDSICLGGIVGD